MPKRLHIEIKGAVQGIGFRPFVYRLATELTLTGWVVNDARGVSIDVEGPAESLTTFLKRLTQDKPPNSVIHAINSRWLLPVGYDQFEIRHSHHQGDKLALVLPDLSICEDCRQELFDPADRRYGYPFINCTNCGPRFTIIRHIPYDRPLTTMAEFTMCPACQTEYDDPLDRRFHAQPNACPDCGPQLDFQWSPGGSHFPESPPDIPALERAAHLLSQGGIVAVKGLGGFHLAAEATNDMALQTLRKRKGRVNKPFAVMAPDLTVIRQFAELQPPEEARLTSPARPIVLLKKKPTSHLSEWVAPGNQYVGVMLPYTPLHYLLLSLVGQPLVMTSGNYSEEPIVKDNATALDRLAPLADAFLLHDRDIHIQCDDSVVRVFEHHELPIRRSRGYAPFPVKLPFTVKPILAVGGELKNSFCLTKNDYAFMSQHIGDMENLETLQAFEQAVAHYKNLFQIEPAIIACDQHPGYLSTKWAKENCPAEATVIPVQHHQAHIAAVMAEHGLDGQQPVIGFSFDGTGYGPDGAIWGGEVLVTDYGSFRRVAHLAYVPLPGGDAAIKRPYRTALAHLWAAGVPWEESLPPVAACPTVERGIIHRQLESGLNSVPTSSFGRLFDAVASLIGIRQTITYEAQAAIELEAIMAPAVTEQYEFGLTVPRSPTETTWQIEAGPVIQAIVSDLRATVPVAIISAKFHLAVAQVVLQIAQSLRERKILNQVALSGGVFQNITLLSLTSRLLRANKFVVLSHRLIPPNDGGLALGQAVVANFQHRQR